MTTARFAVRDPATDAVLDWVDECDDAAVDAAIAAAEAAGPAWRAVPAPARGELLAELARRMRADEARLGALITAEGGKPTAEAIGEVRYAASFFAWFAGEAPRIYGETIPTSMATFSPLPKRQQLFAALANGMSPREQCASFIENEGAAHDIFEPGLLMRPAWGEFARRLASLPRVAAQALWVGVLQRHSASVTAEQLAHALPTGLFSNTGIEAQLRRQFAQAGLETGNRLRQCRQRPVTGKLHLQRVRPMHGFYGRHSHAGLTARQSSHQPPA